MWAWAHDTLSKQALLVMPFKLFKIIFTPFLRFYLRLRLILTLTKPGSYTKVIFDKSNSKKIILGPLQSWVTIASSDYISENPLFKCNTVTFLNKSQTHTSVYNPNYRIIRALEIFLSIAARLEKLGEVGKQSIKRCCMQLLEEICMDIKVVKEC